MQRLSAGMCGWKRRAVLPGVASRPRRPAPEACVPRGGGRRDVTDRERLPKGEGDDARRRRVRARRRGAKLLTYILLLLSFFSRVGDPGRLLFCPPFLSLP